MNINEIAKLSGVSRATVSRYLNNGYVSQEKRIAIQNIIDKTGYQPSTQAQNLRRKVTKFIGVIIPRLQSETVSRMVDGISETLNLSGYQLLLANTQNDIKEELKYLQTFKKTQVDGIIFMGTFLTEEHYKIAAKLEVPMVVLAQQMDGFSCVYQDDYHAAKEATTKLLQACKKVGYIGITEQDKAVGLQRKLGFIDSLKEHDIDPATVPMVESDFTIESGYKGAQKLFTVNPAIDSIFCATDNLALGALKYIKQLGKKVPADVQLIGFGDTAIGGLMTPPISSVHYPYKTSGKEAARLLLEILDQDIDTASTGSSSLETDLHKEIKMGFSIVEKGSTR